MPFALAAEADCDGKIRPESFEIVLKLMFLVLSKVNFRFELLIVDGMMCAVDWVA